MNEAGTSSNSRRKKRAKAYGEGNEMNGMLAVDSELWSGQRFYVQVKEGNREHLKREGGAKENRKRRNHSGDLRRNQELATDGTKEPGGE